MNLRKYSQFIIIICSILCIYARKSKRVEVPFDDSDIVKYYDNDVHS